MSRMALIAAFFLRLQIVCKSGLHALYKTFEILAGTVFLSPPGQTMWQASLGLCKPSSAPSVRTAMVAHVFYPELLGEVLACWRRLPCGTPLHLSVPHEKIGELRTRLGGADGIVVHEVANRGRDIAPFLSVLSSGALEGYDAVLKLHTKRSPHLRTGDLRRRLLFTMLAGHPTHVRRILRVFADASVGHAGWHWMWRTRASYWHANEPAVRSVMDRMAPGTPVTLAFFEGSMFWFRPAALDPLRRLGLTADDFDAEAGQTDGALHHAVERCFGLAARAAGYQTTDLRGRTIL